MENDTAYYESQADAVSSWQGEVESTPVGFGAGRSLLTEKKNKVKENTERLEKIFGKQDPFGPAGYKLDGYSKQALSKQSWLAQNKKRTAKRVVKGSTSAKKSGSKNSSPKHHHSPPRERREWQENHHVHVERKPRSPASTRKPKSPARRGEGRASPAFHQVAISSRFLQKMALSAWYDQTCQSIENELRGARAHDRRKRRLLVAILVTWRRLCVRNARLRRLSKKYLVNSSERLTQVCFRWWKQTIQMKLSGYYFLQKSRKYDLHRKFRAWRKSSMVSLNKNSYLHIMEKHLLVARRKETLRSCWSAWREESRQHGGGGGKDAGRMRESLRVWAMRTKLNKVEERLKYEIASKAEVTGMRGGSGGAFSESSTYRFDEKGNIVKAAAKVEDPAPSASQPPAGNAKASRALGKKVAELRQEQRVLSARFRGVREEAVESAAGVGRLLEDVRGFLAGTAAGVGSQDLEALTTKLEGHLERSRVLAEGCSARGEEEEAARFAAATEELEIVVDRKQAQLLSIIDSNNRRERLVNSWMVWVTHTLASNRQEAVLVQNLRRGLAQAKFNRLTQHILLRCPHTRRLGLHRTFRNHKTRLLFAYWRNEALMNKIQKGKIRLAEQRLRKIHQYAVLKRWRVFAAKSKDRRSAFLSQLARSFNPHLSPRNLVRAWQTAAVCGAYDRRLMSKGRALFRKGKLSRSILAWSAVAKERARDRVLQDAACRRMAAYRARSVISEWRDMCHRRQRLECTGQYVYTQHVKRVLAEYLSVWKTSVLEINHARNKQQLKKLIKQMQRMLTKQKDKIEMVEEERDDASKKVGDLVTAVTNLNWKIQYSKAGEHWDEGDGAPRGRITPGGTPVLHLTRK